MQQELRELELQKRKQEQFLFGIQHKRTTRARYPRIWPDWYPYEWSRLGKVDTRLRGDQKVFWIYEPEEEAPMDPQAIAIIVLVTLLIIIVVFMLGVFIGVRISHPRTIRWFIVVLMCLIFAQISGNETG